MNDGIFEPALDSGEPLAAQVKKILLLKIVTNALRPGERLSENELSASLGVSRQPVRDALIRLAEAGLVRSLPQRGTEVTRIAIQSVYSGRFLREAVEVAVIREAAVKADPSMIEAMDRIIEAQEVALAKKTISVFWPWMIIYTVHLLLRLVTRTFGGRCKTLNCIWTGCGILVCRTLRPKSY
jgi:DNA-binding GntR family transcriptional regulator